MPRKIRTINHPMSKTRKMTKKIPIIKKAIMIRRRESKNQIIR